MNKLNDAKRLFSRFAFFDRIKICQYLSFCSIGVLKNSKIGKNKKGYILPWNADSLMVIALLDLKESKIRKTVFSKDFLSYLHQWISILNGISFPTSWLSDFDDIGIHAVFSPLLLQQKHYQEYSYSKLFRYNCLFNYDNKIHEFLLNKTNGVDYIDFCCFALMPQVLKETFDWNNDSESFEAYENFIELLLNNDVGVAKYLTISYEDFLKQTKDKCDTNNLEQIFYSYKVFSEKPLLVIDKNIFLISSHSLDFACTDGFFVTVTFNEAIKDRIGKYAMEDYLYSIAKESNMYTLVPEDEKRERFIFENNENDPADLIFKNNDTIVIVESKECIHVKRSWINDKEAIEKEYKKCIEGVSKLLNLYRKFKQGTYNPYHDDSDKNKETYLIYLTLQYYPYYRDKIINCVSKNTEEKEFLNGHLFIADYYSFEIYFLYQKDIIHVLKQHKNENCVKEFGSHHQAFDSKDRIPSFQKFVEELNNKAFYKFDNLAVKHCGVHLKDLNSEAKK